MQQEKKPSRERVSVTIPAIQSNEPNKQSMLMDH